MSSARRGPRAKQPRTTSSQPSTPVAPCTCPTCTGEEGAATQLLGELLDDLAPLADSEDALEAELAGSAFLAMVTAVEDDMLAVLVDEFIPEIATRPSRSALSVLRAIGAVAAGTEPRVAGAASAAADRMVAAGVPEPTWGAELAEPVQVTECAQLSDATGALGVLVASFRRAGHGHALVIVVDQMHCAAAADIFLVGTDQLPAALDDLCGGEHTGIVLRKRVLDPAEFRWYVEEALDSRAVHDNEDLIGEPSWTEADGEDDEDEDEDEPPYPVMAVLTRARLAAMPEARRPAGARSHDEPGTHAQTVLDLLTNIMGGAPGALRRLTPATLPAKRRKKDGPAPTYQIKVGLRGAKPPIWRRLLVPGDLSLADLHHVIQVAFDWDDSHMHVFETPYGDFGRPDRELEHRAEAPVTLEQVAPEAKDKIRYTYDFGDDWEHELLVEKVLEHDSAAPAHPRCTGGRRAAPPEDCGGIWGYAHLVQVLADPGHPDHEERLEWLGLDDPSHFDPEEFEVDEVNEALADLR